MYQIFQPLQLFAQTYPHFDHYWQLEMDMRITGDSYEYLEAMSAFAKAEPLKQSVERASYRYMPDVHGSYDELLSSVNASVQGKGIWGPISIPEVEKPIGIRSPTTDPANDNFKWGVGLDADLIATTPCSDVDLEPDWPFHNYLAGFSAKLKTPRFFCPQAVVRTSWNLLNAVHTAQVEQGLRLPSEATMPSFALWHGLKISLPPAPWFINPRQDARHMDEIINGGPPSEERRGWAQGTAKLNGTVKDEFYTMHPTWRWSSLFPGQIMDHWLMKAEEDMKPEYAEGGVPYLLEEFDGKLYAPNVALHPIKTAQKAC